MKSSSPRIRRLRFASGECWKLSAPKNLPAFLRALHHLHFNEAILYLEMGGNPPDDVKCFLDSRQLQDSTRIAGGTLAPTPTIYRLAITAENLESLASLEDQHPTPVGSIHIHAYHDNQVLFSFYDAFLDPLWVSKTVEESRIRTFAATLGCMWGKVQYPGK